MRCGASLGVLGKSLEFSGPLLTRSAKLSCSSRTPGTAATWKPSCPGIGIRPDLTFFSGAKESKGWQAALERYKKSYQSAGHEMGKLEFANLRVEMLGSDAAFVRGEFHLTMSDGKTPHGLFTLIFRKVPDGWKIVTTTRQESEVIAEVRSHCRSEERRNSASDDRLFTLQSDF